MHNSLFGCLTIYPVGITKKVKYGERRRERPTVDPVEVALVLYGGLKYNDSSRRTQARHEADRDVTIV